ncbi:hypothetical protein [Capnocytophaga leadbetteri]
MVKFFLVGGMGQVRRVGQVGQVRRVGQKNERIGRCIEKNTNFVLYNNKLKTK